MRKLYTAIFLLCLLTNHQGVAQDLDQILEGLSEKEEPSYIYATFKGTTIINGQSVEIPGSGDLNFKISHRFGAINTGIYEFFGLDQATTRFGFEYGLREKFSLSLGRNSFEKTYDGAFKVKILRQQTGLRNIPVTVSFYSAAFANTLKWEDTERENLLSSRLSYASQLLIAHKFGQKFSLQLSPTYIHKNLVPGPDDQNNILAAGIGARYKLAKKFSLNAEYFYLIPGQTADDYVNSLAIGFDIQTGGHVFQLQVSNTKQIYESGFISETAGEWLKGDIFFGFNIYRVFPMSQKRKNIM
jgi:hypothetical protein